MAAFNKVVLVGRLTRDVETVSFANGGMVSKFGFAVSNRKKNNQTGQWEDVPMFIDCEAFNRGEFGKLANTIRDYCRKGSQILIEGALHLDQWDDKQTGAKRSKHKIVVEAMQLLDPKPGGGGPGGGGGGFQHAPPQHSTPQGGGGYDDGPPPSYNNTPAASSGGAEEDIPF